MTQTVTRVPMTALQQGMVLHHLREPSAGVNVQQLLCQGEGRLDLGALERAVEYLVDRHVALRLRVDLGSDPPVFVEDCAPGAPVQSMDWESHSESRLEADLQELLYADRRKSFELESDKPLRVTAITLPGERWSLLVTVHHIAADGRSYPILLRDLLEAYDSYVEGLPPSRDDAPSAMAVYEWHAAQDWSKKLSFWQSLLGDVVAPTRIADEARIDPREDRLEESRTLPPEVSSRLESIASALEASMGSVVHAAWGLVVGRLTGETSVMFGSTRTGRPGTVEGIEDMVGTFITTTPVRLETGEGTAADLIRSVRTQNLASRPGEHVPLLEIQKLSQIRGHPSLFDSLVIFDVSDLDGAIHDIRPDWTDRRFILIERTPYPVTLYAVSGLDLRLTLAAERSAWSGAELRSCLDRLCRVLTQIADDPSIPAPSINVLSDMEQRLVAELNDTQGSFIEESFVAQIDKQAVRTPTHTALEAGSERCSYAELSERARRVAAHLAAAGVAPGDVVGVAVRRSIDMVVVVLGIAKTGAAYLPLDPAYPDARLRFCITDAAARFVVASPSMVNVLDDESVALLDVEALQRAPGESGPGHEPSGDDVAYMIYTSGSTGVPKGVVVTHNNVANFFGAMDEVVPHETPGRWLAVTSLAFDISVLELFWTLARGFTVVLHAAEGPAAAPDAAGTSVPSLSMFFFGSGGSDRSDDAYRLVLESARFADRHGFEAVWTPERHFHQFGGLYPNPSVLGAAIAAVTERVQVRAGSVVLPLHSPLRVAEEWSVVDNLSGGRAGIALASGWQPDDFVLAPDRYEERREVLFEDLEVLRKLWGGEAVRVRNPLGDEVEVRTLPRPLQDTIPLWITAAGSRKTYGRAGAVGANVLTHLLGQTLEEVADKIKLYRDAYRASGYPGRGHVTLMLHTFVGHAREAVKATVEEPLKDYLRSAAGLVGQYADAWTAYKQGARTDLDRSALSDLSEEEFEGLLDFAFHRYFETSGLFGSPDECATMLQRVFAADVDEVACLLDFGVEPDTVLKHLPLIVEARDRSAADPLESVPQAIRARAITHFQCTPSQLKLVLADLEEGDELAELQHLFVGGEALDAGTAAEARGATGASITNLYGPTETTVWSTTSPVTSPEKASRIGRPVLNTTVFVTDKAGSRLPPGVPGELRIGGAGVTRGYRARAELTAQHFVPDPGDGVSTVYRTGDLVRMGEDGSLWFLGRLDDQVKLRGHRIEPGEVSAVLRSHDRVRDAVAVVRSDGPAGDELVAYVIPSQSGSLDLDELRRFVGQHLPVWMTPTAIIAVEAFPMTPNQKVDRKALPRPWPSESDVGRPETGSGPLHDVSEIWESVLGINDISPDANFFELGGHSLLAIEVQRRLQEKFERRVPVTELFRNPTIRALADYFGGHRGEGGSRAVERAEKRRRARGAGRRGNA